MSQTVLHNHWAAIALSLVISACLPPRFAARAMGLFVGGGSIVNPCLSGC
jgi:hypothetical protein